MKLESFDSFSQFDLKINEKQTATFSVAVFPQKLDYLGLNTFTPQPSTPDLHQRGYQVSAQHRYVAASGGLLTSQVATSVSTRTCCPIAPTPIAFWSRRPKAGSSTGKIETADRVQWQEIVSGEPEALARRTSAQGRLRFLPQFLRRPANSSCRWTLLVWQARHWNELSLATPTAFTVRQNEFAWFVGDQWRVGPRLSIDLGLRFDRDSVTDSTHAQPRAGLTLALTSDRKTLLKAGGGLFYDRVPLNVPAFPVFPDRTILTFDASGGIVSSIPYSNVITGGIRNPRSEAWNIEVDREVIEHLLVRVAYQQRNTVHDLVLAPLTVPNDSVLSLSNRGRDFYREFQITGRYQIRRHTLNASYVRSKATGDLNDFNQFFGNDPQAVIQPDARGPLSFDAPNRFLAWGEFIAPWKLTVMPVFDIHTGFPYSVVNQSCATSSVRATRSDSGSSIPSIFRC